MNVTVFTAAWCAPCKSVKTWIDNYPFVEVIDADENAELATQFGVRSLPTFIKHDNGEIVDIRHGAMTERDFKKWVE